jgi:hypothetical protein
MSLWDVLALAGGQLFHPPRHWNPTHLLKVLQGTAVVDFDVLMRASVRQKSRRRFQIPFGAR